MTRPANFREKDDGACKSPRGCLNVKMCEAAGGCEFTPRTAAQRKHQDDSHRKQAEREAKAK